MPIIVRQTPVGVLGQLAVMAGQVRGQQLQMGRDMQLMSMALAAGERGAAAASRRAEQAQAFKFQRAAAAQMAKRRPTTPDAQEQRRKLRQFVSKAEAAEVFDPRQIKQARIYADLGDEKQVRSILSELPKVAQPTARRRELQEQISAVTEIGKESITGIRQQLDTVNKQLGKQYSPEAQQFLRENPRFAPPEIQESLAQQQQLEEQIAEVTQRTTRMQQMLQMGLSIPEQLAFEAKQEGQLRRQQEAKERLEIQRARGIGGLTEREELAIDLVRDRERDKRTVIDREIARLSKDLAPFQNEEADDRDYLERIRPIQAQIRQLELERTASHGRESTQISEFVRRDKGALTQIVTDANGQRWRFTGRYQNGKPLYEAIE